MVWNFFSFLEFKIDFLFYVFVIWFVRLSRLKIILIIFLMNKYRVWIYYISVVGLRVGEIDKYDSFGIIKGIGVFSRWEDFWVCREGILFMILIGRR